MASTSRSVSPRSLAATQSGLRLIARLAYALMFAGILVLALSGIGTFALGQAPMTHWVLMLHVAASGMFTIGLTVVALTWTDEVCRRGGFSAFLYWLLLLSGVVVILSGVVPMTPLFGTEGQHLLYLTHRYSGMVVGVAGALHLLTARSR